MAEKTLEGVRVAILATDGFEEAELFEPRRALESAGATVAVLAPKSGKIQGFRHHDKGKKVSVDQSLGEASAEQFDALLLPGGALNADALRMDPRAQAWVGSFDRAKKPIAAICHAPWLLVSAGVARGRTLTSWPSIQDDLRNAGADWRDNSVIEDGNWVTSRGPDDLPSFNPAMVALFARGRQRVNAPAAL
jgi:protease I